MENCQKKLYIQYWCTFWVILPWCTVRFGVHSALRFSSYPTFRPFCFYIYQPVYGLAVDTLTWCLFLLTLSFFFSGKWNGQILVLLHVCLKPRNIIEGDTAQHESTADRPPTNF